MFKSLSLKHFRSHRESSLNFHPGVNVIVGLSRSGKTNIFRALRWLAFYRPVGDSVISELSEGITEVKLLTDISKVKLTKDSKAIYNINGKELFGFGSTVPEEVTNALNISEINIQDQIDEHFLITKSPGEVAKTINEIIRIEKVDSYISSLTTKINSSNQKINILEEQNRKTKEEIDSLNYVDDLNEKVTKWTGLDGKLTSINKEQIFLEESLDQLSLIESENKTFEEIIDGTESEIKEIETIILKLQSNERAINLFEQFINFEEKYQESDIIRISELIEELEKTNDSLSDLDGSIDELIDFDNSLKQIQEEIYNLGDKEGSLKISIMTTISEYLEILSEEKKCPVCYGVIDKYVTDEIKEKMIETYLY